MHDPVTVMTETLAKLKDLRATTERDAPRMSPELLGLIAASMKVFRKNFQEIRDIALELSDTEPEFYELLDDIDSEIAAILAITDPTAP
jgi:hypothetical protein